VGGVSLATAPEEVPLRRVHLSRALRRVWVTLLTVFLACGLLGVFGVRSHEVKASGGGYDLAVTYARAARPGLAIPWSVEIHKTGGFDGPITVSQSDGYFDLLDENGLSPAPTAETTQDDRMIWEFDPPVGDTLTISFDGRVGPAVQSLWPAEAVTAVLVDGEAVVQVRYRTRVFP
jgi:hypothetical protein